MTAFTKLMLGLAAWAIFAFVVLYGVPAKAQGFTDEPTCYSWSGGHKSAGSFSKCNPELQPAAKPRPVPVASPAPVVQPPTVIYQTTACPSLPEPAKPAVVARKRPKPAPPCKP